MFKNALSSRPVAFILPLLTLIAGCAGSASPSGSGSGSGGSLAPGGASYVYAIQYPAAGVSSVLQFTAGANGSVSPLSTLTPPTSFTTQGIATDSSGQVYIAGYQVNSPYTTGILVYPAGSTSPSRTIMTPANAVIAVDGAGLLYALNGNSIYVFSATANGNAAPIRIITSSTSQLGTGYPINMSVDAAGNIFVATTNTAETSGSILEFSAGANGNVTPSLTISLSQVPFGVAKDLSGNIYVAENYISGASATSAAQIAEFSPGATTPSKTITLTGTTPSEIGGVCIDKVGNIYAIMDTEVGSGSTATNSFSIVALASSLSGNVSPTKQMSSTALTSPYTQIAIY